MENYEIKGKTTTIRATSRQSVKIHDQFYTIEFSEERVIPEVNEVDLAKERESLWDCVNFECDDQIRQIAEMWQQHDEELKKKIAHK